MSTMKNIFTVMLGSGLGGGFRFISSEFIKQQFPSKFPLATFVVNLLGCLIIGMIYGISIKESQDSSGLKLLLATGFCGGFTTFSAFASENLDLIRNGNQITAFVYILLSLVLGIAATFIGSIIFK